MLTALALLLLFTTVLKAQSDSLKVTDLTVLLNQKADTTLHNDILDPGATPASAAAPTDYDLTAYFKLNHPENTSEVYIKIGAATDASQFKNETLTVVQQGQGYKLMQGTALAAKFWAQSASYKVTVTAADLSNVKWMTVYAKDKNGVFTSKKYFKIR